MVQSLVVKLGTSVLTGETRELDRSHMVELVRQLARLHEEGVRVTVCSSGAIAAGAERLGITGTPGSLQKKQMLAAVGQSRLMEIWERLFGLYGVHVGQLLLTREDIRDRHRYLNARDTLRELLAHDIVPIINENDAVATAEIKVGDNDVLSALCVLLVEADLLLLLTDQPGLFTGDPRKDAEAELIAEVTEIDERLRAAAGGSVSGLGVGGMETKLEAAEIARRSGADVVIADGSAPGVIERIVRGERLGTRFPALETPLEGRKRWIYGGSSPSGAVCLDAGAVEALRREGGSLLPAGVTDVEGTFQRGETVRLLGPDRRELGRGIVRYGGDEVRRIAGCQSERIAEILGYDGGPVVVHRDDMILL